MGRWISRTSWERFLSGRTIEIKDNDSLHALRDLFNHVLNNKKLLTIYLKDTQPFSNNCNPLIYKITSFHSVMVRSRISFNNKLSEFNLEIFDQPKIEKNPLWIIRKTREGKIFSTLTPMQIRIDYKQPDLINNSSVLFLFELGNPTTQS